MSAILRPLLVVASLVLSAAAQTYDLDKTTAGTLGATLQLDVRNAPPNALMVWMPSFQAGPTPLSLLDPTDPRVVDIGLDLSANWTTMLTSPAGTATLAFSLPNVAAYAGIMFRWQSLDVPGATHIVDRISDFVVTQIGLPSAALPLPVTLAAARAFAALAPAPSTNAGHGDVLLAGGGTGSLTAATGLASTELWDFRQLTVHVGPNMTSSRALHVAVPLADGRTLMVGGADALGNVLSSCEIYDPVANTFTPTGSMGSPRVLHAACRLADGRVMAAGGTNSLVDTTSAITGTLASAELWNPATGLWTSAASLGGNRLAPALTLLSTGRVMASGGVQVGFLFGIPISAVSTTAVQLYNAGTNSWTAGAAMPTGRAGHHYNQVTLLNGRVLMTGGVLVPSLLGAASATPIANADVYDPVGNSWAAGLMSQARSLHSATLLTNGRVVVCGGAQGTLTAPTSIANVDQFDPGTGIWTSLAPLLAPRSAHAAWLQPDGLLILLGGQGSSGTVATVETLHF
jgi:hypothetical protein